MRTRQGLGGCVQILVESPELAAACMRGGEQQGVNGSDVLAGESVPLHELHSG
jgi:hypothetical protein